LNVNLHTCTGVPQDRTSGFGGPDGGVGLNASDAAILTGGQRLVMEAIRHLPWLHVIRSAIPIVASSGNH
jgi:hypothetical protein